VNDLIVQGRRLGAAELQFIRALRESQPPCSRAELSRRVAEQWQWRNPAGQLKDMAARTLLLKLHRRGLIELPAPQRGNGNARRRAVPPLATAAPGELALAFAAGPPGRRSPRLGRSPSPAPAPRPSGAKCARSSRGIIIWVTAGRSEKTSSISCTMPAAARWS